MTKLVLNVLAICFSCLLGTAAAQDSDAEVAPVQFRPVNLQDPVLKHYAIVIGNGDYLVAPDLLNAVADAELVSALLRERGYTVFDYTNLDKFGFERVLRRVLFDVDKDSEVIFYYAGHGLQIAGGNYLVPVDAALDNAYDVPFEAISLSSVVNILGARARLQLVILDSCRNNPFGNTLLVTDLSSELAETRDGFNTLTAPINSLLAFATAPGMVAYDGANGNSPFTSALVEAARTNPDMPVGQLLENVRRAVYHQTEGKQVPWESSTLVEVVTLNGSAGDPDRETPDTSGIGDTRGLVLSVATGVVSAVTGSPDQPTLVLEAPLEREVDIGTALNAALASDPDATITIIQPPANGFISLVDLANRRRDATQPSAASAELEKLVYTSAPSPTSADQPLAPVLADTFSVAVNGVETKVEIKLDADPCDSAAGDHLDPDGVGLGLYPNEIEPDAAILACNAAIAAYPEAGRFHYQRGRAELALLQFDAARADFEKARDLGHVRAWYALGVLVAKEEAITSGKSAEQAPQAALDLYRVGVERGDPFAYHALGKQLLRYGSNAEVRTEGYELLSRALELGHTFAMNELGSYFIDPDTAYSDPPRGFRYLKESAARGDIYGFDNLGYVYLDGLAGVESDPKLAETWFEKAASGGHPLAPGSLGRLWYSGALGTSGNHAVAVEWYDLGLSRGDGWSGANAGWIISEGNVPGMGPEDAALRAAKAAALSGKDSAASARELLADLPVAAVNAASQRLVNEFGGEIAVDGAFGAGSRAEMKRVLDLRGEEIAETDPVERAILLAGVYWRANKFRIDLY